MKLKRIGALCTALALTLSLVVASAQAVEFNDVPEEFWGYPYIKAMSDRGYAKGYEDGSFKPNGKMTAVETLLFCARAAGIETTTQARIAADHAKEVAEILPLANSMNVWAADEMAVGVEAGVLTLGELEELAQTDPKSVTATLPDGKSYLEQTMSRENICKYLVRAMQLEPLARSLSNYSLSYKYKDASEISADLQPYVYVLTNYGVVNGKDTGNFDPNGAVTRAEMTTMLCRALDFMADAGIQTELSEYTTYNWEAGTVTAVTGAADGSIILTLYSNAAETTQSFSVPATAKIYEDNMLTSTAVLKNGQYVRLNLSNSGAVQQVRISGTVTAVTGTVADLADGQLSLMVNNRASSYTIDRFTKVVIGKSVGGREIIDEDAGYSSATCYVDGAGHLAAVRFDGGTQMTYGLVESVEASSVANTTTLGVTSFDGTVRRYTVPNGIAITVNGVLGSLSSSHVGRYVKLRVANEGNDVQSVAVDTVSSYVQGPIKRLGTVGSARSVYIGNIFTNKEVTYTVSASAAITFNGEAKTLSQLEAGWYVTALVANNMIVQIDAFPGSAVVEGTLTTINFTAANTVLQLLNEDGSTANYTVDLNDLPAVYRNNEATTIDKLRGGDKVTLTIRYNQVDRIDATSQSANLTGVIDRVVQERTGAVSIDVILTGTSEPVTYTLADGLTVTQNGASSNIRALAVGQTIAMVTDGDGILSVDITSAAASSTQITGTVLLVNNSGGVKTLVVTPVNASSTSITITVDIRNAPVIVDSAGEKLSIKDFSYGDTVFVQGSYDGATFMASVVIKQ